VNILELVLSIGAAAVAIGAVISVVVLMQLK